MMSTLGSSPLGDLPEGPVEEGEEEAVVLSPAASLRATAASAEEGVVEHDDR